MAYEAMNNAQAAGNRLVVILNDNDMSIAPPVAGCRPISRGWSRRAVPELRDLAKRIRARLPRPAAQCRQEDRRIARGMAMGGTLFEELGFYYVGPIDGHNLDQLIPVLENVRDAAEGPCLIHVVTQKGKGYAPGRGSRGQISWRAEVRRRHRRAGQGAAGPPPTRTSLPKR
jgi:1-deoxy-D-xylulose-5-phosphate synthase